MNGLNWNLYKSLIFTQHNKHAHFIDNITRNSINEVHSGRRWAHLYRDNILFVLFLLMKKCSKIISEIDRNSISYLTKLVRHLCTELLLICTNLYLSIYWYFNWNLIKRVKERQNEHKYLSNRQSIEQCAKCSLSKLSFVSMIFMLISSNCV